jgi:hypothetical protein
MWLGAERIAQSAEGLNRAGDVVEDIDVNEGGINFARKYRRDGFD